MTTDYHALKRAGRTAINLYLSREELENLHALGQALHVDQVFYRGKQAPKRADTVRLAVSIALMYVRSLAAAKRARSDRAKLAAATRAARPAKKKGRR